ncbi:MAG: class I SAM-dependent methyltransferase [Desulforudis sp.]|nr:MAG: class I SAM-dependent methyltransferase [Desulforudis sp.]
MATASQKYLNIVQEYATSAEYDYITKILKTGYPDLQGMWKLMDTAWQEYGCDPNVIDERINHFYTHPVWLLNGLFVEQDAESLAHRRDYTFYVTSLNPKRVADIGGGFGTLARMIGEHNPAAEVHIVEPHPHPAAIFLAEKTPNVRYVPALLGEYDVLIATDVFEHVPDPLSLVEHTAAHLRMNGAYLIKNCFWPVIKCHLPTTFHFRWSWDNAMTAMNLFPDKIISYGKSYIKTGSVLSTTARNLENRSRFWFRLVEFLPRLFRRKIANLLISGRA